MDYERDVKGWCAKHNSPDELRWARTFAKTALNSLSPTESATFDGYERAIWEARLKILRTKALLMGIQLERY